MDYESKIRELELIISSMQQALHRDSLTGLHNRIGFYEALKKEWARAGRRCDPVSIVFLDMDQLKATNTHYGHGGGDAILAAVGRVIGDVVKRQTDVAARIMGDEFAVLLPETDHPGAVMVAERIIAAMSDARIENKAVASGYASVTYGIATAVPDGKFSTDDLLNAASKAMLSNKKIRRVA